MTNSCIKLNFSFPHLIGSASIKSLSESRLNESFSGSLASFPTSPMTSHGKIQASDQVAVNSSQFLNQAQNHQVTSNETIVQSNSQSKSEETLNKTNLDKKLPNLQKNKQDEHREKKYKSDTNSAMGS